MTTSVRDSVTVVHGPAGCAHHNFSLLHTTGLDNDRAVFPNLVSSGMMDTEIIFGGEEALERAIREAIRNDVSVVYVLSTCIAETIGDDVAAVCGRDWSVPVIPVVTAGFLGGSFQTGVTNALTAIAGTVPRDRLPQCPGCVNVIGEKNLEFEVEENYKEVSRLLSLLGLRVNLRFVHYATVDDIARLGAGTLNILRDENMGAVGDLLYRDFGIPSLRAFPAGLTGSLDFLNAAGTACGIDPGAAVAQEQEHQESLLDEFSDLAGFALRFDPLPHGTEGDCAVSEVIGRLGLKTGPDAPRVPQPPAPPVGTRGVRRMLHRWRRALHA